MVVKTIRVGLDEAGEVVDNLEDASKVIETEYNEETEEILNETVHFKVERS